MKGQAAMITGIIMVLVMLITTALVFMPIYKDLVANQTAGWNTAETLTFRSIGAFLILAIIIALMNYASGSRGSQSFYYQQ